MSPTCTRPFAPYIRVETRIEFLLRRYRTLCEREPCLAARESLNSDPLLYRVELELLCGAGCGVVWVEVRVCGVGWGKGV